MLNRPAGQPPTEGEIIHGTPVFDINGDKVGNVTLSARRDGYFVVEKGLLFTQELFLPFTAIERRDAEWITLKLSKDELKQERWKSPPEGLESGEPARPIIQPGSGPSHAGDDVINLPPPGSEPPLGNRQG